MLSVLPALFRTNYKRTTEVLVRCDSRFCSSLTNSNIENISYRLTTDLSKKQQLVSAVNTCLNFLIYWNLPYSDIIETMLWLCSETG